MDSARQNTDGGKPTEPAPLIRRKSTIPVDRDRDQDHIFHNLYVPPGLGAVFGDLLTENDSELDKGRKLVAVLALPNTLVALVGLPWFLVYSITDATAGPIVALVASIFLLLTSFPLYLYTRITRCIPELAVDALILLTNLWLIAITLAVKNYPTPILVIFLFLWTAYAQTMLLPLHIVLLFIHLALISYNIATEDNSMWPALQLPNVFAPPSPAFVLSQNLVAILVAAIIFFVCWYYFQLIAVLMQRARDAKNLVVTVTDHLIRYDFESAKELLARASSEDHEVCLGLAQMAKNLDRFKPHIPFWIVEAAVADWCQSPELVGDEEESDIAITEDESEDDIGVEGISRGGSTPSDQGLAKSATPKATDMLIFVEGPSGDKEEDERKKKESQKKRAEQEEGEWVNTPAGPVFLPKKKPETAKVKEAKKPSDRIPIGMFFFDIDQSVKGGRRTEVMHKFVDRCHELCELTQGVLHTFVLGHLIISWNAVSRILNAESKATQFLYGLQQDAGDPMVYVNGAIVSGRGRPIMAGVKYSALTIAVPWHKALFAIASYAAKRRMLLVDGATRLAVEQAYDTCAVDALQCPIQTGGYGPKEDGHADGERGAMTPRALSRRQSMNNMIMQSPSSSGFPERETRESYDGSTTEPPQCVVAHSSWHNKSAEEQNGLMSNAGQHNEAESSQVGNPVRISVPPAVRENLQTYVLYEVTGESGGEDEWMYMLQRTNQLKVESSITASVLACVEGNFASALEHLRGIEVDIGAKDEARIKTIAQRAEQLMQMSSASAGIFAQPATL